MTDNTKDIEEEGVQEVPFGQSSDEDVERVLSGITTDKMTAADLKILSTKHGLEDKRFKLINVLNIWRKTQKNERKLKKVVAYMILGGLATELIAGNTAFFLIGFGLFKVPEWVAQTFFIGMYAQIISVVLIVVKSLFPTPKSDSLTELNKMVDKL